MRAIRLHVVGGGLLVCSGMRKAKRPSIFTAISVALVISLLPASCQDLILSAHENHSLGNCTLQIEDIDSQTAKVWLVISDPIGPMLSEILGVNETLFWENRTLTVARIYAGESSDLVFLRVNRSD